MNAASLKNEPPPARRVSACYKLTEQGQQLCVIVTTMSWGPRPGRASGWVKMAEDVVVEHLVPMSPDEVKRVAIDLAQEMSLLVEGPRWSWDEGAMP